jgi:hypothetical protein
MGTYKENGGIVKSANKVAALAEELKKESPPLPSGNREGGSGGDGSPEPERQKILITTDEVADLVKLPADIAYAMTRSDIWLVPKEEIEILAKRTERALNMLLDLDARWIVGISCALAWGGVYGTRTVAYLRERKKPGKEPLADRGGDEKDQKQE